MKQAAIFQEPLSAEAKLILLAISAAAELDTLTITAKRLGELTSLSRRAYDRGLREILERWPGSIGGIGVKGAPLKFELRLITVINLEIDHSDQSKVENDRSDQSCENDHSDHSKAKNDRSDQSWRRSKNDRSDQSPKKNDRSDQSFPRKNDRSDQSKPSTRASAPARASTTTTTLREEVDAGARVEALLSLIGDDVAYSSRSKRMSELEALEGAGLDAWLIEIFKTFGRKIGVGGATSLAHSLIASLGDAATARSFVREKLTEHDAGDRRATDQGIVNFLQQDGPKWLHNRAQASGAGKGIDQGAQSAHRANMEALEASGGGIDELFGRI